MSQLSETIENILDKTEGMKPHSRGGEVDTYILPFCTLDIQFSDRDFICLTVAEHFSDSRYIPTPADAGFHSVRTAYCSFGQRLDEVFLQAIDLSNPGTGVQKLLRYADAKDGNALTFEDEVRFRSLLEYISRKL